MSSMSMVQRQASPLSRRKVKPWEVYNYVTAGYHKAGVFLTEQLHNQIFHSLGAKGAIDMGKIEYPCYQHTCWSTEAPIIVFTDGFNASWRASHPVTKQRLVAGSVRDPLQMVASAYCYHHEGKEFGNQIFPVGKLMVLGPEEGTELTAKHMLQLVEFMASIFAQPDNNTLRLDFDTMTQSSSGFDREVNRLLDHFFGDLITPEQRSQILENAKSLDANRNASATLSPYNGQPHSSSPECQSKAYSAISQMDSSLLRRYQELQLELGFPAYSS
eukprot:Skav228296  [mRNA]  locus=scaffold209:224795:225613:- [translate_table: standard]